MSAALVSGAAVAGLELLVYLGALFCGKDPLALFIPLDRRRDRGDDATDGPSCLVVLSTKGHR